MSEIRRIRQNCVIPSSALTIPRTSIKTYIKDRTPPKIGDVVFGEVACLGKHQSLESASGRIHIIHDKSRAIFVFGNRYAPDYYESDIPESYQDECDMVARSGIIGRVNLKNAMIGDPTRIRILGYVCDAEGKRINTLDRSLIHPRRMKRQGKGAKVILCVGTSMNSGKSYAAAACCYALASMGRDVRAAKVTGTASLKDILLMEDCGAKHVADFTYLGYPSTYLLEPAQLLSIFQTIDLKYGNNPKNYLVIELADGILQRETAMLLHMPELRERLYKVIFCAQDALGMVGGLTVLKERFKLQADAISGVCSSSPLALQELREFTDLPVLGSTERNFRAIFDIIG